MRRMILVVVMLLAPLTAGAAWGHDGNCLVGIHAGGIQPHLVCS